jgi:hypothetical protein
MKDKHRTYKPRIVRGQVMMPAHLSAFINICARLNTSILSSDEMREVVEEPWGAASSWHTASAEEVAKLSYLHIFASACRPASVIRTRTTSVCRPSATMRSRLVVASPALTSSTIMSIENPCARRIALV